MAFIAFAIPSPAPAGVMTPPAPALSEPLGAPGNAGAMPAAKLDAILLDPIGPAQDTPQAFDDGSRVPAATLDGDASPAGLTLRQVLHAITNRRPDALRKSAASPAAARSSRERNQREGEDDFDPIGSRWVEAARDYLLDSRVLGGILDAVLDPQAGKDKVKRFSLFGLGDFTLDIAADNSAASVTEQSTQMSFDIVASSPQARVERRPERDGPDLLVLMIRRVQAFAGSDEGMFLIGLAGFFAALVLVIRFWVRIASAPSRKLGLRH